MKRNYYNNRHNPQQQQGGNRQMAIDFGDGEPEPAAPGAPARAPQPVTAEKPTEGEWAMHFASFGSGSSGNCSYLGNEHEGILIDAGVDVDHVIADLERNGISMPMVKGIILTHDHADHIRYAYKLVRQYKHLHIYCTPRLMNGLLRHHNISSRIRDYQVAIFKEIPFHVAGLTITAFETSHDGTDNMGFMIEGGGHKFVVGTDMGVITKRADHYMRQANYLMIEANYDRKMLDGGRYPEYLKNRVRSEKGHLDNRVTAEFVADAWNKALSYVFLCHLSNDNNRPEIALQAVKEALEQKGATVGDASYAPTELSKDVQLYALPRYKTSTWFIL